ncbi:AraC family transcriptional regulator [Lewinellaceae bacterium SD302]|nr:AraC family transcriptional regulator [Lewinellaceae bacterium SD302]
MLTLETQRPFEIQEIELFSWQQRPVKNNFFELVLVKSGRGTQCINYNYHTYTAGSVFLLPPLQCHSFQIEEPSRFVFLKFTSQFFRAKNDASTARYAWFNEAAYVLANYNQLPGDLLQSELDRQHLHTLLDLILRENQNFSTDSVPLIQSLMSSVLELLLRNIRKSPFFEVATETQGDERINNLLVYINENISNSALLKVDRLAKHFHLSPTYLGEYFRKNVNVSLREYIIKTKLKLVEIRLLNSDLTLTEIAEELNFTDVSHLSKTFKRYVGISLRDFRKQGEYHLLKRNACVA